MTQAELNRQVAQATGESIRTIAARGFGLVPPMRASSVRSPRRRNRTRRTREDRNGR